MFPDYSLQTVETGVPVAEYRRASAQSLYAALADLIEQIERADDSGHLGLDMDLAYSAIADYADV